MLRICHYFHTLENFPARISRSSVSYNSDNFLLEYKYLVGTGGATPENYTVAYHSQISFQRPAVSWEFCVFARSSRQMVGQRFMLGYMFVILFFDSFNSIP